MKTALRWAGRLGVALLLLIAVGALAIYVSSEARLQRRYDINPAAPTGADGPDLARGKHVATVRGCASCHGSNLAGRVFIDHPMIGRFVASNLTQGAGGIGGQYSDTDWARAIRHGVNRSGRGILVMPSAEFFSLSDADLSALIAYVKSVPSVDNVLPPSALSLIGRGVITLNRAVSILSAERIDHNAPYPVAPAIGVTADYGRYLASTCSGCHGAGFSGGAIPGAPPNWPPAANLTPEAGVALVRWSLPQFVQTLRTGNTPEGRALNPRYMPWKVLGQMTDEELHAVWLFLRSLPPKSYGNR
jgi:mono/diheme cytochrome c family protein